MQTLGVSRPEEREDNLFQRLFWPTVRNQYDVDVVGRRGFWLAFAVGALSGIILLASGSWFIALLTASVFLLGAAGIRERSTPASATIFTLYFLGVVFQWILTIRGRAHPANPLVSLVCIALLLSCVRATALSKDFAARGDTEFPSSTNDGVLQKVSNSFPKAVWPKLRIVFFVLAGCLLALDILGAAVLFVKGPTGAGM